MQCPYHCIRADWQLNFHGPKFCSSLPVKKPLRLHAVKGRDPLRKCQNRGTPTPFWEKLPHVPVFFVAASGMQDWLGAFKSRLSYENNQI